MNWTIAEQIDELTARVEAAETENAALREALEFYTDPGNMEDYISMRIECGEKHYGYLYKSVCEPARRALAGLSPAVVKLQWLLKRGRNVDAKVD